MRSASTAGWCRSVEMNCQPGFKQLESEIGCSCCQANSYKVSGLRWVRCHAIGNKLAHGCHVAPVSCNGSTRQGGCRWMDTHGRWPWCWVAWPAGWRGGFWASRALGRAVSIARCVWSPTTTCTHTRRVPSGLRFKLKSRLLARQTGRHGAARCRVGGRCRSWPISCLFTKIFRGNSSIWHRRWCAKATVCGP